jgi:hypothetical protein
MTTAAIKCHCAECGVEFARKRITAEYCSTECRKAFNNRRAVRGAALYDLFCAMRRERSEAKELGIWSEMCRLELRWNEEDAAEREGRKSYVPPKQALDRLRDRGATPRGELLVKAAPFGRR